MTNITIALGIPHTPWIEERSRSLEWLVDALTPLPREVIDHRVFGEREKNYEWSGRMWNWAATAGELGASHFLTLQDDVIVAPDFWAKLVAMIEMFPNSIIGLEVVHPATRALAETGCRWYTTSDCVIGVGYVIPIPLLRAFLEWRGTALRDGAIEAITEDTLLAVWCLVTGRQVLHPIPTFIDHDTSVPSTYGNDGHANRRPPVRWDNWTASTTPYGGEMPHLGRFYDATPEIALRWVKDLSAETYERMMRDDGRAAKRELGRARLRNLPAPEHRVMVATPTRGLAHPAYATTIAKLTSVPQLDVETFEIDRFAHASGDVVRARSRFVRMFLEGDATHLLFVDDDVSFEPMLVTKMLAAEKDFVVAPYPSRRGINWARAADAGPVNAESAAYHWALHLLDDKLEVQPDGLAKVAGFGLGCALLSRACLERMVSSYRALEHGLVFRDRLTGAGIETVALFQLLLEGGELYSEDYSFCRRWRALGGDVWLYLGPGAPATHHGDHAFRGHIEAFGLRHETT